MLVLKRKIGEEITLRTSDGDVRIVVQDVRWNDKDWKIVRLAFDAPPAVKIFRSELLVEGLQ